MDYKPGDLMSVDAQTERAIMAGIEIGGFDSYHVKAVRIRERVGVIGNRVFKLKLEFSSEAAIDHQVLEDNPIDPLVLIGRNFARSLQREMLNQLPIGVSVGDKIIVPEGEYRELRRKSLEYSIYYPDGKLP